MLGGEGNENGEKTTIALISKKASLHVQHTFFVHFFALPLFARLRSETSRNFLVTRLWRNFRTCSCSLFFIHCRSFSPWWPLAFLIFSPALKNFHVVLPTKNVSFAFYLSLLLSVALFLVELRWPIASFLFFSVFLFFYIPNLWAWQLI